ncbi:MAG: class II aldolase/adducin family protein [Candidatus Melainabacteria bacterium]|nr:class II aldolase/adducin family protein [Candidatus Melainabacteria bacterium]
MGKTDTHQEQRESLVEVGKLCYERRYICGTEGNFSIRLGENLLLTTPASTCKGRLKPDELVLTDLEGKPIEGQTHRPSTELAMHITAYQKRPDIKAIVHAHPTVAVGFTVAGQSLAKCVLPEVVCTLGFIPVAPYATPSTNEVSESISELVTKYDALVMDHHGALALGKDIWDAYYKLETLEHHAETMLVAHLLGGVKTLRKPQVEKLLDIVGVYGLQKPASAEALLSPDACTVDGDN